MRRTFLIVPAAAILTGCFMSWRLTAEESGFAAAARYVQVRHGRLLSSTELMTFYFRGSGSHCQAPALPRRLPTLKSFVRSGYRYALVDRHGTNVTDFIRGHSHLVRTFVATGPLDLWENVIDSENTHPPVFTSHQDKVWLYDLQTLRFPSGLEAARKLPVCRRDVVA